MLKRSGGSTLTKTNSKFAPENRLKPTQKESKLVFLYHQFSAGAIRLFQGGLVGNPMVYGCSKKILVNQYTPRSLT